ncbi:tRNA glutamyl-Q(34) synthetase GluQRS [Solicola sp. PLA-1-18]|uniref:tRNA glutamyl-Q(34) synthetase GluQRS n=1 Tax=Solicola sp. PLA-1-18 TaxID=3380532 RepID=UPI003B7E2A16
MAGAGRYAPTPSGDLHLGNLRTAVLAWLCARSSGRALVLRVDDLDRVRPGAEDRQLADLAALGVTWDGPVRRQSEHGARYASALDRLREGHRVYPCFCTRREIAEAATAPHGVPGQYPGTCRRLTASERETRALTRPPAWRLDAEVASLTVRDEVLGEHLGPVDDVVLVRNDGVPSYQLTTVVDDAADGVDQVVRGDDLLASTPRQAHLCDLLGLPRPSWVHVPLAVGAGGQRLAKRDGAVTVHDLAATGVGVDEVRARILASLGLPDAPLPDLVDAFDLARVPREPWVVA